jgi:hypothetical protein
MESWQNGAAPSKSSRDEPESLCYKTLNVGNENCSHFKPSLIFADETGAYPKTLFCKGKLLALLDDIKLW